MINVAVVGEEVERIWFLFLLEPCSQFGRCGICPKQKILIVQFVCTFLICHCNWPISGDFSYQSRFCDRNTRIWQVLYAHNCADLVNCQCCTYHVAHGHSTLSNMRCNLAPEMQTCLSCHLFWTEIGTGIAVIWSEPDLCNPEILLTHQSTDSDHRSVTASAGRCYLGSTVSPRVCT